MRKSKDRQHNGQKKKDRQHNGQIKRTDNTMAKIKRTKGQTTIYKALHIKLISIH